MSAYQLAPDAGLGSLDPGVARAKFEAEIAAFQEAASIHRGRGIWLLDATFPRVLVAMVSPRLRPASVVCGVLIDFTDYDLEPPSVRLVNPFTAEPYRAAELPTRLPRKRATQLQAFGNVQFEQVEVADLMQAHDPSDIPFLCIPGVREYHEHPAHTSDDWLSHRGRGEGSLAYILEMIHQYGVQPVKGFSLGLQVTGLSFGEPPA